MYVVVWTLLSWNMEWCGNNNFRWLLVLAFLWGKDTIIIQLKTTFLCDCQDGAQKCRGFPSFYTSGWLGKLHHWNCWKLVVQLHELPCHDLATKTYIWHQPTNLRGSGAPFYLQKTCRIFHPMQSSSKPWINPLCSYIACEITQSINIWATLTKWLFVYWVFPNP